ncbi:MAG: nicotinate-nucleotide adenylyltransferase [bacterium]
MKKNKKIRLIGIFGGTFNPIHNGHLLIAEDVRERLNLDKVLFIPAANPPHKKNNDLAEACHRLEMVKLAIRDNPCFSVSDIEIKRGGMSYSIETIKTLKEIYQKGTELFFIMGADSILEFMAWKEWESLLGLCNFVVAPRPGYEIAEAGSKPVLTENVVFLKTRMFDTSSTEIRKKIKNKEPIECFVPDAAVKYIRKHKLYT